jgi:hypothetical protein
MPLKDVLEAIGLGAPFYLAAATCGFFFWLDRNASAQATRAISEWLKGQPYGRIDVRLAITAAFDRLYTSPLLRLRALLRSAMLSSIIWIVYTLYRVGIAAFGRMATDPQPIYLAFFGFLVSIILSDYISLFVVRRCLFFAGERPIASLFLAAAAGSLVIIASLAIGMEIMLLSLGIMQHYHAQDIVSAIYLLLPFMFTKVWFIMGIPNLLAPALLVHLWLPLFAVGTLGVRLLYPIFRAVEWAQWFIKQGDRHPLRAIGLVAAVLVFAGAAIERAFVGIIS